VEKVCNQAVLCCNSIEHRCARYAIDQRFDRPCCQHHSLRTRLIYGGVKDKMSAENLSADPNEHDLLGFPGVKAEHPKIYLRRLWLPAENDRTTYPRFYDTTINEMAQLANRVVNSLTNDAARRNEELQGGAFLESEANWILEVKRYGSRIWGEDYGASTRLKSNLGGLYPRWGAWTASGEQVSNDQDM
jgi:hypothetical protein